MRSFVKIYGPPLLKAIKALENIAVNMPEVCIMDTIISTLPYIEPPSTTGDGSAVSGIFNYFSALPSEISQERCSTIISKSGQALGEYDFFFEWFQDPNTEQLNELIGKIDEALSDLGCLYRLTTKK